MIEVSHLTRRYGAHLAVDDLTFTVEKGQICGLLGPNGAGKTTTMNILTGYISPTAGTVTIDGHDILEEPEDARACVGYLPEQPPLYPDMTVREYLLFAAELKGAKRGERAAQAERAAARAGLAEVCGRLIRNLSKGYRQRVGVAQALLGDPKVIILDEPTVGLDPAQVIEIRNLIRQLGRTHTVILSSHILSEVQAVCDRVLILSHGRLAALGAPETLGAALGARGVLHVTALGTAEQVLAAVQGVPGVERAELAAENNGEVSVTAHAAAGEDLRAAVSGALAAAGCAVLALTAETLSLEDVFLQVTEDVPEPEKGREEDRGGAAGAVSGPDEEPDTETTAETGGEPERQAPPPGSAAEQDAPAAIAADDGEGV